MYITSIILYLCASYHYFLAKSEPAALAFLLCIGLLLLATAAYLAKCNEKHWLFRCILLIASLSILLALGYAFWHYSSICLLPRQLFFAAAPPLGYLFLFFLQLCCTEENLKKSAKS